MFLIKEKRKNGTNLCIVQSYRDPVTKVSKTKRIMNIGLLEELQKQYDDPIAHFQQVAKEMSEKQSKESKPVHVAIDPAKPLEPGVDLIKNFGYCALSCLYHELRLDVFFRGRQRALDIDYSLNSVMKLLVYSNILFPGSIKQIYGNKEKYFDKMEFSLNDIYRSFAYFYQYKSLLQTWIHERICENYGRDKSQMYYYVTRHYFETAGILKEPRQDPIVQMGLFVDKNKLPVSYELFSRNRGGDMTLLNPQIIRRAHDLGADRVIFVGDNGNNSTDNLYYVVSGGNGYIVSQSIRSADSEMKDYVLSQRGFTPFGEEGKIKSRIYTRKIRLSANGITKNVSYQEKQIVFYNKKYARCFTAEREDLLLKAKELIASPDKYTKATAYGAAKYVQNIKYEERTGKILKDRQPLHLDEEGLKEEEKYDGYYLFLTSELDENVEDLVNAYSDLWEVEESFKYVNSTYRARPVFLSRAEHMHSHYLLCFVSLALTRILEMKIQKKYSLDQVVQSLRKCNYVHIEDNYYIQSYYDSVLELVGKSVGVDFSKRYGTLCMIRERIGATKKRKIQPQDHQMGYQRGQ